MRIKEFSKKLKIEWESTRLFGKMLILIGVFGMLWSFYSVKPYVFAPLVALGFLMMSSLGADLKKSEDIEYV